MVTSRWLYILFIPSLEFELVLSLALTSRMWWKQRNFQAWALRDLQLRLLPLIMLLLGSQPPCKEPIYPKTTML